MFDVKKIRKDFPMFETNKLMQGKPMVYFDNAATTFKPRCVIEKINEYYESFTANTHRGDYDIAQKADTEYEHARHVVASFLNARDDEISFNSGSSMGMNVIAQGLKKHLTKDDEILITDAEHASNVLPWFRLSQETGCKINYIPLTEEGRLIPENLEKVITKKTKIVSVAQITNVLGFVTDIKALAKIAHEHGALFVCDGAQSVPHMKVDVKNLDVDFLVFSGHKCVGPTGIGAMYCKGKYADMLEPLMLGGGMNTDFNLCGDLGFLKAPYKFEAGTQNVAGAIGLARALEYLDELGMDNIAAYEKELKTYAVSKLKKIPEIILYNENSESGIIAFNYKGVHAQDMGTLLATYGICVRSGQHCAKLLHNQIGEISTVRASLYFYNTKEEIDAFVEACKKGCDFLDAFFIE